MEDIDVKLMKEMVFKNRVFGSNPREMYKELEEQTNDKESRKQALLLIKQMNPEYNDDDIIQYYQMATTLSKLKFMTIMACTKTITSNEKNRKEIIEIIEEILKELKNIKGDVK